ncbi:MAG: hypothetical protein PQ971_01680 [Methanobacterium sp.]
MNIIMGSTEAGATITVTSRELNITNQKVELDPNNTFHYKVNIPTNHSELKVRFDAEKEGKENNHVELTIKRPSPEVSTPTPSIPEPTIPKPIKLSGSGQEATENFHLNSGLARFKMKHQGSSNFAIVLYSTQGEYIDLLVNEIGSFDGSTAVPIHSSGEYMLDVSADGPGKLLLHNVEKHDLHEKDRIG